MSDSPQQLETLKVESPRLPYAGWALVVFAASIAIRAYDFGRAIPPLADWILHIPDSTWYTHGLVVVDNWWTQPMTHLLQHLNIALFGNDPSGWVMRNLFIGSALVSMVFLLSRRVFSRPIAVWCATGLVMTDPTMIALSRGTGEDVVAAFFLVCAMFSFSYAIETDSTFQWSLVGVTGGLATATRQYILIPLVLMVLIAFWRSPVRDVRRAARLLSLVGVVAFTTYLISWTPWFSSGRTMLDWWQMHVDGLKAQESTMGNYAWDLGSWAGPRRWFYDLVGGATRSTGNVISGSCNNPLVWFWWLPACALMVAEFKRLNPTLIAILASVAAPLLFFTTTPRPVLLYAAATVLPFGSLAIGYCIDRLSSRFGWTANAVLIGANVLLYPVLIGTSAADPRYRWILEQLAQQVLKR